MIKEILPSGSTVDFPSAPPPSLKGKPICRCDLRALEDELKADHGNIVAVFPVYDQKGSHFIATKFDSSQYIKTKITDENKAKRLFFALVEYIARIKYTRNSVLNPILFVIQFNTLSFSFDDVKKELQTCDRLPSRRKDVKALWPGKLRAKETVPEFFGRVWQKYVGLGLSMALIKKIDPKFYAEIVYYKKVERENGRSLPFAMQLPTQRSKLANLEEKYKREGPAALTESELTAVFRKMARDIKRSPQAEDEPRIEPGRPNGNYSRHPDKRGATP